MTLINPIHWNIIIFNITKSNLEETVSLATSFTFSQIFPNSTIDRKLNNSLFCCKFVPSKNIRKEIGMWHKIFANHTIGRFILLEREEEKAHMATMATTCDLRARALEGRGAKGTVGRRKTPPCIYLDWYIIYCIHPFEKWVILL